MPLLKLIKSWMANRKRREEKVALAKVLLRKWEIAHDQVPMEWACSKVDFPTVYFIGDFGGHSAVVSLETKSVSVSSASPR